MLFTVFSVSKFIFCCLADIIAGLQAETSARLYTRLCAELNFTLASLIFLETIINGIYTVFMFIFSCSADLMVNPGAKTSARLYTRLCAEPNFT